MTTNPLSIQLYTLRDLTAADFPSVLRQVKAIGYGAVEAAGYGSLKTAAALRKACDDNGLIVSGMHHGLPAMEKNPQQAIDDAIALGTTNLIIPWTNEDRRNTPAAASSLAQTLDRLGEQARKAGLVFGYHNHDFEFQKIGGKDLWDYFLEQTSPDNLRFELDVFWSLHAGVDPVKSIQRLSSRLDLLHMKDMAAGPDKKFAPCGAGILDLKAVYAAGRAAGVQWYVVEQDNTYGVPPMETIRDSFNYLQRMTLA